SPGSRWLAATSGSALAASASRAMNLRGRIPRPPAKTVLMGQAVHDVVDAELVRVVREIDWREARIRPFPILSDVVIEVGDEHQPFGGIVVLEHSPELRRSAPVVARDEVVRIGDFEE